MLAYTGKAARCPVGKEWLGYLIKGEVSSFLCEDCQFVYTWDMDGNLLKPTRESVKKLCGCGLCKH